MLHWFYHVAFDARADLRNMVIGEGTAVLEAEFVGRHIGTFAGIEPTATRVSKFPLWLPRSPAFDRSFDMREALRMHSRGICRAVEEQDAPVGPRGGAWSGQPGPATDDRRRRGGVMRVLVWRSTHQLKGG